MFIEPRTVRGWIEVISGPMYSGKTEELIRRVKQANEDQFKAITFKPAIDKRYHPRDVVSHNGKGLNAIPIDSPEKIRTHYAAHDLVAIDEAQFFDPDLVRVVTELADEGVRIIIAGLDMDYKAEPFGPIPALLAKAEYITKLQAICMRCGNAASYTFKLKHNGKRVEIGEKELYEALCRSCFNRAMAG